jgi:hypothetical protein
VNPTTNEIASALTFAYKLMFVGLTEAYIILGLEWVLTKQRRFFANAMEVISFIIYQQNKFSNGEQRSLEVLFHCSLGANCDLWCVVSLAKKPKTIDSSPRGSWCWGTRSSLDV